jgi:hypothetical protein
VTVTPLFFSILFLVFCEKTTGEGLGGNNHTRTEGTDPGVCISSTRDVDVREEAREVVKCFFTDPCRLNGDRPRGAPSKEYRVDVCLYFRHHKRQCVFIWLSFNR